MLNLSGRGWRSLDSREIMIKCAIIHTLIVVNSRKVSATTTYDPTLSARRVSTGCLLTPTAHIKGKMDSDRKSVHALPHPALFVVGGCGGRGTHDGGGKAAAI